MYIRITTCLLAASLIASPVSATPLDERDTPQSSLLVHPWKGKRVAFLGDSITDAVHVGTTKCYWEYLAEWLDLIPQVYAKNGNQWDGVLRQAERLKADGTEVDAIIIFAGTNDYNAGIPLGEWYDYAQTETTVKGGGKEVRTRRMPQTNGATFRGRINRVMDYLKTNFPEQQIIILTPIHRAAAQFSNQNIQPEEAFPNKLGLYVDAYVNAVKETAGVWAVPVIDLNSLSGLYPMNDAHARYFHDKDTDRLHPNAEGHRRMALTLMFQLLALPASFR